MLNRSPSARWAASLMAAAPLLGCQPPSQNSPAHVAVVAAHDQPQSGRMHLPPPGETRRVGGDAAAAVTGSDGDFRAGRARIDTPFPAGYPLPTPPGAIDLKTYPPVRLAEVHGHGNPDGGMNRAFWSLFYHIKRHDIAMTSPVEMTYERPREARTSGTSWSMAFLYRTPELNGIGPDGAITVRDAAPVSVVAVGLKGDYSMTLVQRGMTQIEDWLAQNPQWRPAGSWRTLYYNGPSLAWWNKWAEVQLPIEPAETQP
jgi:hypothetical protein